MRCRHKQRLSRALRAGLAGRLRSGSLPKTIRLSRLRGAKSGFWSYNNRLANRDVQECETIAQSLAQIASERGWGVDALINNAGFALGLQSADCADLDDWERMISVNCMALVRLTRLVLPQMVARKSGTIINIGSIAGSYPYPGGNVYGATKAFVKQFSLNLRADLFDKNIRVTNIEPGLAQSEFSLVRFKGDKAQADSVYAGTQPLLPEDIAEAVAWVLSLPSHVNINRIELMPTTQAAAALNVCRNQDT